MASKGNKFGTLKGVFTPSILTILGVIMYLRLPWIVGQAGLWATLAIVLVAHIISATTGLSVASIATDKKVETGGTYYMISRSLGLSIGGTLGLALFVGLSFSVSLYLIGFAETLLTAFGLEVTLNSIRLTGAITLATVTVITFISTNLALKMQFVILAVLGLSLVSILIGQHDLAPQSAISGAAVNSLPWIALFAIFFPAVTGFEAGVSMSGDLANPKKSIPRGTILAIFVGLAVYICLVLFFSYTVDRNALINDTSVLLNISFYSPLVVAGIWGATLSSAFGSILGAPRILQATAIDRITPKIFAKGVGSGNEPRNALILTFLIALSGILIGELNVIARVVSIFFIITYGFLNLTCAIENWAGSDFRPSFRIPAWISIIGAIACFVVMIQLDLVAMIGATLILGAIFLYIKRKELRLQTGDTWAGIWSSLVKYGLLKLSISKSKNQRNWRPNIILFSGGAKARPHLIDMARALVGKQGVFTNFELIESSEDKYLFAKPAIANTELDHLGKSIITRQYVCRNIYDGMQMIARVYGFTGFEPNTVLMGWARNTVNPTKFRETVKALHNLDFNLVFLNFKNENINKRNKRIDLWWDGKSRNLNFGLGLLKYITTEDVWREGSIRLLIVNYNSAKTDSIYALANQVLDNSRLFGSVKVINNSVEKINEVDIIRAESADADLAILELREKQTKDHELWIDYVNRITDLPCSTLIIEAGSAFEPINANTIPDSKHKESERTPVSKSTPIHSIIDYPSKELLAEEVKRIAIKFEELQNIFVSNSILAAEQSFLTFQNDVESICSKLITTIERNINEQGNAIEMPLIHKTLADFAYQAKSRALSLVDEQLDDISQNLSSALSVYLKKTDSQIKSLPEKLIVGFSRPEVKIKRNDSFATRNAKSLCKFRGLFLGWPINRKVEIAKTAELFLYENRLDDLKDYYLHSGLTTFRYLSSIRRVLVELCKGIEKLPSCGDRIIEDIQKLRTETNQLLADALLDFCNSNKSIINTLNASLEQGIQRMSFVIEKPEAAQLLYPYKKIVRRKSITISDIELSIDIWRNNLKLFSNKSLIEFIFLSLKYRFSIKLRKQVDELNSWTKTNLLQTITNAKEFLDELKTSNSLPKTVDLYDRIKVVAKPAMQERFETFFREVNDVVKELPTEINVNSDEFFRQIELGHFPMSDTRVIEIRRKVQFYIGIELVSNARNSMEGLYDGLKETSRRLGEKVRLATFNIENILLQNEGNENLDSNSSELREKLIDELLEDISYEETKIKALISNFDENLKKYLISAIEPLNQMVHTKVADVRKSKSRFRLSSTKNPFSVQLKLLGSFFNKQMVTLLYSQSEGIMLAQKLTRFEKEHRLSNQSIQEMLASLSGSRDVLKKIPFYYFNLFSGSTTLNTDLWIERPYEQKEAERIATRFKNGYTGALLITGSRNSGKTTLSKYIALTHFPDVSVHIVKAPKGGSARKEVFINSLQKALGIEVDPNHYLSSSPLTRVIIINDLELWWERHEEGLEVLEGICRMIENWGEKIFFVVNCGSAAYQLMNRILKLDTVFMGHIECQPFDAKEIKDMVMSRHRTGGLNLILNDRIEEELSEWNFARLFNKYFNFSNGNPGSCLQMWLSNITSAEAKTIHIKNPSSPNTSNLNGISNELWLVILQLIIHRRCTVDRFSRVLRCSEMQAGNLLREMQRSGIVEERFPEVFAINSYIEPHLFTKLVENGLC